MLLAKETEESDKATFFSIVVVMRRRQTLLQGARISIDADHRVDGGMILIREKELRVKLRLCHSQ